MIPPLAAASSPPPAGLLRDNGWWLFCLLIVCLKFVLLGINPQPQVFMGDSGSYLWTALSGWIPPDRSFLYGFVIRWVSLTTHSLESLLILQAFTGAGIAILLAFTCRRLLFLSTRLSYATGFIGAIDPLQLVWERYLMTETLSLFLYACMLLFCLAYLQQRKLWQLALIQVLAVLAISLRISYLLVVEATTVLLPLIAFLPIFWSAQGAHSRAQSAKSLGIHLALSILLMLGLHLGYKQLNGYLAGRPPAYLYSSGFSILATWAPVLQPADSSDPRLAQIISEGNRFHLRDPRQRNSQLYSENRLVARWKNAEPDLARAEQVAKQTALHALLHRPISIATLGARTYLDYFHPRQIHRQAVSDLGTGEWPNPVEGMILKRLRYAPPLSSEARSALPLAALLPRRSALLLRRRFVSVHLRSAPVSCPSDVRAPDLCSRLYFPRNEFPSRGHGQRPLFAAAFLSLHHGSSPLRKLFPSPVAAHPLFYDLMKAFISGGAGFIGSHLLRRLLRDTEIRGVIVFDNFSSGQRSYLEEFVSDARLRVVEGDLKDLAAVRSAMDGSSVVYHLAANPDIAKAVTQPDIDFWEGTYLTQNVLEAMRLTDVRRIFYTSGSGVYGEDPEVAFKETYGPACHLDLWSEQACLRRSYLCLLSHVRMFGRAFRFANVVGPRQTHGVGYDFARRLKDDPSRLRILGDGSQSKSYIHVEDVLDAIWIAGMPIIARFDIFNVATDDYITVNEIADIAVEESGLAPRDVRYEFTGGDRGWKGDVPIVRFDVAKIKSTGWKAQRNSAAAVRDSIRAMIAQISKT